MGADPGEGGLQSFLLIDHANVSFHLRGIAHAIQELIAGESRFHLGIHPAMQA